MKVTPFIQVDDISFSTTRDALVARLGPPARTGRNAVALNELDYGDSVYRFQDSGRLEEVTRLASVVSLGAVAIPFPFLKGFVLGADPLAFERAGFIVSPRYGLAFVPGSPSWVTALAHHCIDAWRAL
jgi:hypothetical protein